MVEDFRETKDNITKKENAIRAYEKSKELNRVNFFSAYPTLERECICFQKEYAIFLENVPTFIKEATKTFFIRKFSDKFIDVDFKNKPSGMHKFNSFI